MEKSFVATVDSTYWYSPNKIIRIFFRAENIDETWAKPGQFITLPALEPGSKPRRPFSIFQYWHGGFSVLINVVGKNTGAYSRLRKGNALEITGPHGNGIEVEECGNLIIAGSVGFAALDLLIRKLEPKGLLRGIIVGSKDKEYLEKLKLYMKLGSIKIKTIHEAKGLVTDLLAKQLKLKKNKTSAVIACGPLPMLKKVAEMCAANGNPCTVVLEQTMACGGKGSCLGDVVFTTKGEPLQICKHGPAFNAKIIDWNKLLPEYKPIIKIEPPVVKKVKDDAFGVVLKGQASREDLWLPYPFMNGAGCLNYPEVEVGIADISRLGMVVTKGVSLEPWAGNPGPRVCEVPSGMLNSIGLQNDGVKKFINEHHPRWRELTTRICVNITGKTVKEYTQVAKLLSDRAGEWILDVNIGCPNVKKGGILFGLSAKMSAQIVRAIRKAVPETFIFIKPTPNTDLPNLINVIRACKDEGADALVLANSRLGMAIDINTMRSKIAMGVAGLTGPILLPQTVALVFSVAKANLGLPIVASGGVSSWEDAIQLFAAGTNVVAFGTELLSNGKIATEVHNGVARYMNAKGISHIQDLVGKVELPVF
jgi:dihydroorotate dehydrogenase (NAD+) catalytic subunit